ncbi:methyltransferase domain-containing protein [Streptomyces sp. NPDC091383]|uniref:methyltransferase domain-containing protein n=1 Tax=Streptomyces sp. NPDC091383 TaxID=3365996 RepID=UPI00380566A8
MANLSKDEARMHREASALVALKRDLTEDEKETVLEHWQESSTATNSLDGAFFTPMELAWHMRHEVSGNRILDLCAGVGRLAYTCRNYWTRRYEGTPSAEVVCVERNPVFVEVGKKVLPEARWICGDVFNLPDDLGTFDTVIANPPFGYTERAGQGPRYKGRRFEYHVVDIASTLARRGVFIVPQESAPFVYSGTSDHRWRARSDTPTDKLDRLARMSADYERFALETGLEMHFGIGMDTGTVADQWRGTGRLLTEIVHCDFEERPGKPVQSRSSVLQPLSASAPRLNIPASVSPPKKVPEYAAEALF